jgi:hypothetical protein
MTAAPSSLRVAVLLAVVAAVSAMAVPSHAAWLAQGTQVAPTDSIESDPVIAADGSGGAFIAWQDARAGSSLFAQHLTADGLPAPGWPLSGLQVSNGADYDPVIVADGAGGAFIAASSGSIGLWHVLATYGPAPPAVLEFTVGDDRSARNASPAAIEKMRLSPSVLPQLEPDGNGGVYLAYEEGGLSEHVTVAHFPAQGIAVPPWGLTLDYGHDPVFCRDSQGGLIVFHDATTVKHVSVRSDTVVSDWPGHGTDITGGWQVADAPGIASDGQGGAFLFWQDRRVGYEQTYAQHLTGAGAVAPGWPDTGLAVCSYRTSPGLIRYSPLGRAPQRYSCAVPDDAGGAYIAWSDQRTDDGDIYAQHLLGDGTLAPGWPVNGLAVAAAPGLQSSPSLAADGAGGVLVSWQDGSGIHPQVHAQHLSSSGIAPWDAQSPVCSFPADQFIPRLVADASGGTIVAWQDARGGSNNIVATHLTADGTTPAPLPCELNVTSITTKADSGSVQIAWYLTRTVSARVLCRQMNGPWVRLEQVNGDADGVVRYGDLDAIAGCRYAYALEVVSCSGAPQIVGLVWIDIPIGNGFSFPMASAPASSFEGGRLGLIWHLSGSEGLLATVSRRDSCSAWAPVESTTVDESGLVQFTDHDLFAGHSLAYRIAVQACGRDTVLQETWLQVPSAPGFIQTAAALTSATVDQTGAHLTWRMQSGPISVARIYRQDSSAGSWIARGQQMVGAGGVIHLDDTGLRPGWGYSYELGLTSCGSERIFEGSFLRAPALTYPFTLRGSLPNPSRGALTVSFSLANAEPATLEVFDLSGRLATSRSVGGMGPGEHQLDLSAGLRPGVYLIRLTQSTQTQTIRSVLLP